MNGLFFYQYSIISIMRITSALSTQYCGVESFRSTGFDKLSTRWLNPNTVHVTTKDTKITKFSPVKHSIFVCFVSFVVESFSLFD